ncbi:MAG: DUF4202 domain-containing protein [Myxococcota bacterium]
MSDADRFARAIAAIDAANADDPHTLPVRGRQRPKEQAHAELVSEWVRALAPDASEALRLAARAHHVRRWEIPRGDFPAGRAGYHRWRKALQDHHADVLRGILEDCGYDQATIARTRALLHKQGLGRDPEVQTLEDALCLVFVETQFTELAAKLDEEKLLDVTRKTLRKMSPDAIARATGLPLDDASRALLERAAQDA